MFLPCRGVHDQIIQIRITVSQNGQNSVYQPLEGGWCIAHAKSHDCILQEMVWSDKRRNFGDTVC